MCGIAGIVNLSREQPPPDRELLEGMVRALEHRGPDGYGVYRDSQVALGHARLSIIDLAGGWQPMANERGTTWITFNGEIFNYLELRQELTGLGHRFRTESDTEVLLAAYEEFGLDMFERLNGQWAFVIWDEPRQRLVLSRDRLGILPLFHCVWRGQLRFGSEVKALFADPTFPRSFSANGLAEALTFWSARAPLTPFDGVSALPPGAMAVLELGRDRSPRVVSRWLPSFPEPGSVPWSSALATTETRDALGAAARIRLRADVPVGSYLSGGLDSTIVAGLVRKQGDVPLRTFSVEFSDREFDEREFQSLASERLGTDHSSVSCSDSDIAEVFPEVVYHAEAPLLRTAPAPLWVLSRRVREAGFRVVLTGEGADEVFAGYDLFREDRVRRFWARQPSSRCRPQLLLRLYPYLARSPVQQVEMAKAFFGKNLENTTDPFYSHRPRWDATSRLLLMVRPERIDRQGAEQAIERLRADLPPAFARWSPLSRAQWLEMETLLSGYLLSSQGDRMLMANSVEGRFPFLDPGVLALLGSLSDRDKLGGLREKLVLKRAFEDLVPAEIRDRVKQPYRAPVARPFFQSAAPSWVAEVLTPESLESAGVFLPQAAAGLIAKCRRTGGEKMSNSDEMAISALLSIQLLHRDLIAAGRLPATKSRREHFGVDVDRVSGERGSSKP